MEYLWPLWSAQNTQLVCTFNTLKPRQHGRHFADDILKYISWTNVYEFCLWFHWSLFQRFQLTLIQMMSWRQDIIWINVNWNLGNKLQWRCKECYHSMPFSANAIALKEASCDESFIYCILICHNSSNINCCIRRWVRVTALGPLWLACVSFKPSMDK